MAELPRDKVAGHPLYNLWRGMIRRCHSPNCPDYKNYGGRGISVCEAWRASLAQFAADVPPRPSRRHTLDRINNDGNYEPGNIRWATRREQARNTRCNRNLSANGEVRTLEDWAILTGIPKSTLFNRVVRGWDDDRVVNTPVQAKGADYSLFPPGGRQRVAVLGLNVYTVASRLRRGWSFDEAISAPVKSEHARRR
jgi:hypothetical protein